MQHKSILVLFTLLAICSSLLGACKTQPTLTPTSQPLQFTDGLNRTVQLPSPAQRVVSLAASNTEILFAIGAASQVVGRDEFSDYPVEAKDLPSVGGSFGGYNLEMIASLKPDLVLAATINTPEQVKALEDLGITVYLLPNPVSLDELFQNVLTVGKMTGHGSEAEVLVASLQQRVNAVEEKITMLSYRPAVYYELDATDPNAPFTTGKGTFLNTLIDMAGGWNVGSALDADWAQISAEKVVELNPQIILLGDAAYGITPESVKNRPGWNVVEAVKNGQIFPFDDNLVSRPGPRMVDGLEALAKLLHPEVFK